MLPAITRNQSKTWINGQLVYYNNGFWILFFKGREGIVFKTIILLSEFWYLFSELVYDFLFSRPLADLELMINGFRNNFIEVDIFYDYIFRLFLLTFELFDLIGTVGVSKCSLLFESHASSGLELLDILMECVSFRYRLFRGGSHLHFWRGEHQGGYQRPPLRFGLN